MALSPYVASIPDSLTLAISAKAKAMKAAGRPVVGFGAGEPDFDTPQHVKDAAAEAMRAGLTKYTPASGTPELKAALVEKFRRDNGLEFTAKEVLVSNGGKQAVAEAIAALAGPGDEVIIPVPSWHSYPEMAKAVGAKPVTVPTTEESGFRIGPAELEAAITPRTRLFVFCSPSNPTGSVYTAEELKAIGAVLATKGVYVVSDEIYEKLLYDGAKHVSIAGACPYLRARTVICHGVSKTYAMTGWRIGFAAGPAEVIGAMGRLQSHTSGCPCSISQAAALAALAGDHGFLAGWLKAYDERRRRMVDLINEIPGMSARLPGGAFYVLANVSDHVGTEVEGTKITGSSDFAQALLEAADVALVPGVVFGAEGYVRLSYATSMDDIVEGLGRLKRLFAFA
jgi:aspartate aminotransferase